MLWTSYHVTEWVESLGLDCSTVNLRERGVHGGVLALDNDYGYEKLAMALQIPLTDIEVRSPWKQLPLYCILVLTVVFLAFVFLTYTSDNSKLFFVFTFT